MGSCWDGKWDPLGWEIGSSGVGNGIHTDGMGNGILWGEKWDPAGMGSIVLGWEMGTTSMSSQVGMGNGIL